MVLAGTILWAGDRTKLYSDPAVPSREVLNRLNLKQEWTRYLPMDGRKDGFISIQLSDGQMFVQTRSGMVALLDADKGADLAHHVWQAYQASFPLAINSFAVYAVNGGTIYALNRAADGSLEISPARGPGNRSGRRRRADLFQYRHGADVRLLPAGAEPSTEVHAVADGPPPPTHERGADNSGESPYASSPPDSDAVASREPQPTYSWEVQTRAQLEFTPLMSYKALLVPSPTGTVVGVSNYPFNNVVPEVYRLKLDGPIAVGAGYYDDLLKSGQVEETAYIGDEEATVYAIAIASGKRRCNSRSAAAYPMRRWRPSTMSSSPMNAMVFLPQPGDRRTPLAHQARQSDGGSEC